MTHAIVTRALSDGRKLEIYVKNEYYVVHIDGARYASSYMLREVSEESAETIREAARLGHSHLIVNVLIKPEEAERLQAVMDQQRSERKERERRTVRIYLSSRGWGDYSACEWIGDITRPDAEILGECRHALTTGHDVDRADQTDDEILAAIQAARAKWTAAQQPKTVEPEPDHGHGYCYNCESYCYGDCGNYAPKPTQETELRKLRQALDEQNYGIND